MENAGSGAFRALRTLLEGRSGPVWCLAGPGNNGGDALVVSRLCFVDGIPVRIATFGCADARGAGGDAATQHEICAALGIETVRLESRDAVARWSGELASAAVVVDGLFGTGLTRPLEGLAASVVQAVNAAQAPTLSLDLPSGMDCDTGRALGACVRASSTVTFVAPKQGFAAAGAAELTGRVEVVGIGAPYRDLL